MKTLVCRCFQRVPNRATNAERWPEVWPTQNRNHRSIMEGYIGKHLLPLAVILASLIPPFVHAESQYQIKRLTLGVRADAPPFSSFDGQDPNRAKGYTVDLCRRIALRAVETGLYSDIEFKKVTTANRFELLQCGAIDLLCGATTVTLERSRVADFSLFTFISGVSVMYLEEAPETNVDDPGALYVGVLGKTMSETEARFILENLERAHNNFGLPPSRQVKLRTVESHYEGFLKLKNCQIQAYMADREILLALQHENLADTKPFRVVVSDDYYSVKPYAIGIHSGNVELRYIANSVLSELYNWDLLGNQHEHIFTVLSRNFPRKRFSKTLESLFRLQRIKLGQPIPTPDQKAPCP